MGEFEAMRDRHLGQVSFTKTLIKLAQSKEKSVHSGSSQAGPKARKLEKLQINKMWKMKVAERAEADWVALVLSVPEED